MDVPTGPLRQDAESDRSRCEFEESRETASNSARSRWGAGPPRPRQSGLGVPMPSSQERKLSFCHK